MYTIDTLDIVMSSYRACILLTHIRHCNVVIQNTYTIDTYYI